MEFFAYVVLAVVALVLIGMTVDFKPKHRHE